MHEAACSLGGMTRQKTRGLQRRGPELAGSDDEHAAHACPQSTWCSCGQAVPGSSACELMILGCKRADIVVCQRRKQGGICTLVKENLHHGIEEEIGVTRLPPTA